MMSSHVIAQTAASNDLYIERHSCEIKLYAYNSLICVEIRTYQAILIYYLSGFISHSGTPHLK